MSVCVVLTCLPSSSHQITFLHGPLSVLELLAGSLHATALCGGWWSTDISLFVARGFGGLDRLKIGW